MSKCEQHDEEHCLNTNCIYHSQLNKMYWSIHRSNTCFAVKLLVTEQKMCGKSWNRKSWEMCKKSWNIELLYIQKNAFRSLEKVTLSSSVKVIVHFRSSWNFTRKQNIPNFLWVEHYRWLHWLLAVPVPGWRVVLIIFSGFCECFSLIVHAVLLAERLAVPSVERYIS